MLHGSLCHIFTFTSARGSFLLRYLMPHMCSCTCSAVGCHTVTVPVVKSGSYSLSAGLSLQSARAVDAGGRLQALEGRCSSFFLLFSCSQWHCLSIPKHGPR